MMLGLQEGILLMVTPPAPSLQRRVPTAHLRYPTADHSMFTPESSVVEVELGCLD